MPNVADTTRNGQDSLCQFFHHSADTTNVTGIGPLWRGWESSLPYRAAQHALVLSAQQRGPEIELATPVTVGGVGMQI